MDGAEPGRGRRERRRPAPLDEERLRELALHYVGRFATTRARLADYLRRKVRERGWAGEEGADIAALVERLGDLGYVDDRAFALAKAGALTTRGLGGRRVRLALQQAGVAEADQADASALAQEQALASALRFARRKRLGPFAPALLDPPAREKGLAAMVRAGHAFDLARRIVALAPGEEINPEE